MTSRALPRRSRRLVRAARGSPWGGNSVPRSASETQASCRRESLAKQRNKSGAAIRFAIPLPSALIGRLRGDGVSRLWPEVRACETSRRAPRSAFRLRRPCVSGRWYYWYFLLTAFSFGFVRSFETFQKLQFWFASKRGKEDNTCNSRLSHRPRVPYPTLMKLHRHLLIESAKKRAVVSNFYDASVGGGRMTIPMMGARCAQCMATGNCLDGKFR